MNERRILTEADVLRLLAHFFAIADLHKFEGPYYTDRRILEGMAPIIDAMIKETDPEEFAWLSDFKDDLQEALSSRTSDESVYESFVHHAPGRVAREIKRRHDK